MYMPYGFLGMMDDTVGITNTGYTAVEMKSFINVKTAEKNVNADPQNVRTLKYPENK